MFTGLVETVGRMAGREAAGRAGKLRIQAGNLPVGELRNGDSLAVNGVCLTLEQVAGNVLEFHTLAETLKRSNLGGLAVGHPVNLERALRLGDRLGGHLVSGHIDAPAPILDIRRTEDDWVVTLSLPAPQAALVVEKGSVALDGISLTVASLAADRFTIRIIPHTWEATALSEARVGDLVNVEYDLVGKYLLRQREVANLARSAAGAVSLTTLAESGFLS